MRDSVSRSYWLNPFWLWCGDRQYPRFEEPTKALLRISGRRHRPRVCPLGSALSDRLGCEVRGVWWQNRCFGSFLYTFTRECVKQADRRFVSPQTTPEEGVRASNLWWRVFPHRCSPWSLDTMAELMAARVDPDSDRRFVSNRKQH